MSDKKVTGVFVHLPLSDEDCMTIRKHITSKCLTNDGIVNGLLAIGTPVTGGELYPIGYINEDAIGGLATGVYQSASIFRDEDVERHDTVALTRQSDTLAKLAEKDAEIARYREVISRIDGLIMGNNHPVKMFVAIHSACQAALKGPEA
ncbi:hypothetical protein ACLEIY_15945 [Acetobacter tropicalis]|uniref:hypothetical protein n=1 Tax=Acetobacter tropicalis TaxID=104102 RepID=UPI0039771A60